MHAVPDSLHSATLAELGLFNSAFHFAAIGIALVGTDGRWLRVNRSLCQIVGYSEPELLASTFQRITHPDDLDADLNFVKQMLLGEIATYQMEKRYIHKQGHVVWILLSVSLVKDGNGEPMFFISQIQDITARKAAEEELRKVNNELRLALAELNQLRGILPICCYCKKIRDDQDYWLQLETYVTKYSGAKFTHGICPHCLERVQQEFSSARRQLTAAPHDASNAGLA